MKNIPRLPQDSGFTLIELLIALGLGVVLSFGVIQIFQNSKNLSAAETSLSRVQEVGRYAIDVVANDIRMSGFHGDADPENLDVFVLANTGVLNYKITTLQGFEVSASTGTFAPALPVGDSLRDVQTGTAAGSIVARNGSDVIRVKFAAHTDTVLQADLNTGDTTAIVGPPDDNDPANGNPFCLDTGDLVILGNASSAVIFRNTNDTCDDSGVPVADGSGNVSFGIGLGTADNQNSYQGLELFTIEAGAKPLIYKEVAYFVADTGRTKTLGTPVYSLYRMVNGNTPEELVEGVEFLQLQFGQELTTGNMRYVEADTANLDMARVKAIRLGMLVQGFETSSTVADARTYSLAGATISPIDPSDSSSVGHSGGNYLRKPFLRSIKLRNRRPGTGI